MSVNILNKSPNLDFLRALAVCLVVSDHTAKFLGHSTFWGRDINWLGRLGVMLFFVHTCTVLMLSLERLNVNLSWNRTTVSFYMRRAFRIYPLSIAAIAFVQTLRIPAEAITGLHTFSIFCPSRAELISNLALVQNLWPRDARNVIGVLWSLPYEVQMYLVLPFLFAWKYGLNKIWPLYVLWATCWLPAHLFSWCHFLPHFLSGVVAYSLSLKKPRTFGPAWLFPIALMALCTVFMLKSPSYATGAIVCIILATLTPMMKPMNFNIGNTITAQVAKFSYGVYITHLMSMWFAWNKATMLHTPIYIALLVAAPVLLYYMIEYPMMKLGATLANKIVHTVTKPTLLAMEKSAP